MWDWLDPRGRCSNGEYVRIAAICSILAAPLVALLAFDGILAPVRVAALAILWLLTGVMWCVAIRRAHDEDYSANQAYAWMGGPTLLLLVWMTLPAVGIIPNPWVRGGAFVVGLLLSYIGLYSVAHGRDGARPNRFGPPTLQRPTREDRARYRRMQSRR